MIITWIWSATPPPPPYTHPILPGTAYPPPCPRLIIIIVYQGDYLNTWWSTRLKSTITRAIDCACTLRDINHLLNIYKMHIFNYVVDEDFFCQKSMKLHQYTRQGVAICWSYRQMKCALLAKCYTPSKSPECVKIIQINHHLHCFQVRTFNWRRTRKNFNKYMLILVI